MVPGYFYDRTLVGIFEAQEHEDGSVFKSIGSDAGVPEDDHDPENDMSDSQSTGVVMALALMLGLIITIVVARLVPKFPSPMTTLLVGILLAICQNYFGTENADGEHFLNLDSEYIIFGLTPVLILGEILKLDVRLAKRLAAQFFFYGLVGGVVNTILTMLVLSQILPDEYGPEIRLCLAALISTADASFIGRILHGAGVSHRVILLIEGEGMANDPGLFSILTLGKVLYERIHLRTSHVVPISFWEGLSFTTRIVLAGIALGAIVGMLTLGLINFTSNRFESDNRILQIVITMISCYATFFLAEGVFGMSGALAVVTSGWILAWKMWPKIISEQAMTAFWHSVGFIGETLLFLVCGFYIGYEAFRVNLGACIGLSFAIWAVALGCRFVTLFASWPLMNQMGPKLRAREVALWAWCSLKSRIGLALIIEFSLELLSDDHFRHARLSKRDIIFIIGCIFLISNMINGGLSGLVARGLQLDRATDLEEQMKSVFFRHALYNTLRKNEGLSSYLHHTFEFAVENTEAHVHKSMERKPSTLEIDWNTVNEEHVVVAIRSVFLSVLRSLYWEENEANKISIRAVQSLLTATDHSLEEAEKKPILDFYHLMVMLPARDASHSQYRVIYTLTAFAEYHAKAREIMTNEVLGPVKDIDGELPAVVERAWAKIEQESIASQAFARRELSLRFDEELVSKFSILRNLELHKVERLIEKFVSRGLVNEKDSEESHEAFIEDLASIKSTLRAIGSIPHGPQEVEEPEKFLLHDVDVKDDDVPTNHD